jgi:hypothetical protein
MSSFCNVFEKERRDEINKVLKQNNFMPWSTIITDLFELPADQEQGVGRRMVHEFLDVDNFSRQQLHDVVGKGVGKSETSKLHVVTLDFFDSVADSKAQQRRGRDVQASS